MDHNWELYKTLENSKFYLCSNCQLVKHFYEDDVFPQEYYYKNSQGSHPLVSQTKNQKYYDKNSKCSEIIMEDIIDWDGS